PGGLKLKKSVGPFSSCICHMWKNDDLALSLEKSSISGYLLSIYPAIIILHN
ncbi:30399_t:CDS:1, partial [Gigaspora margarita]